jgi:hypothetical protein
MSTKESIDPLVITDTDINSRIKNRQRSLLFIRLLFLVLKKDYHTNHTRNLSQNSSDSIRDAVSSSHRTRKRLKAAWVYQQAKIVVQQGIEQVHQSDGIHTAVAQPNICNHDFMTDIQVRLRGIRGIQKYLDKAQTLLDNYYLFQSTLCSDETAQLVSL